MMSLHAVAGPLNGFALSFDRAISIGTAPASDVMVADSAVAPRHCEIEPAVGRPGRAVVRAYANTFVNGLPITELNISVGDTIHVGRSVFVLSARKPLERARADRVSMGDAPGAQVVREATIADLFATSAASAASESPYEIALANISAAATSIHGFVGLGDPLLELLLDAIGADSGALLLREDDGGVAPLCVLNRGPLAERVVLVRALVDAALRRGVVIVASEPGTVSSAPAGYATRHILVSPLLAFNRVLGALYVRSHAFTRDATDERLLRFVAAVSGVAAVALAQAQQIEKMEAQTAQLRAAVDQDHNMVGASAAMRSLFAAISKVAHANSNILITGESGTGKELVARSIHRNSPRASKPFVTINCAAIPDGLMESELFGHEKGAFTGAIAQRKGRLEAADGGTVFLDEIAELPLPLQAKLLRALQEREFERVGGGRPIKVDVRFVAATNRDLPAAVRSGTFRQDLQFRINVIALAVPPLRERGDDIALLAAYFAARHAARLRRDIVFDPRAMAALVAYDWPGNVRELENVIERAVVLGDGVLRFDDLPEAIADMESDAGGLPLEAFHSVVRRAKREAILNAVSRSDGNIAAAARLLKLHPNYLHRLIRVLKLRAELNGSHQAD